MNFPLPSISRKWWYRVFISHDGDACFPWREAYFPCRGDPREMVGPSHRRCSSSSFESILVEEEQEKAGCQSVCQVWGLLYSFALFWSERSGRRGGKDRRTTESGYKYLDSEAPLGQLNELSPPFTSSRSLSNQTSLATFLPHCMCRADIFKTISTTAPPAVSTRKPFTVNSTPLAIYALIQHLRTWHVCRAEWNIHTELSGVNIVFHGVTVMTFRSTHFWHTGDTYVGSMHIQKCISTLHERDYSTRNSVINYIYT